MSNAIPANKTNPGVVITLTTDFGTRDSYVAAMKGVLLSLAPASNLVDVTHEIPPQDVFQASRVIQQASATFPEGSLHIVVVDPGVGSSRRILYAECNRQRYLAPDNGILTAVWLQTAKTDRCAFSVERPDLCRKEISSTFHGRDIFAPIAGHLARGVMGSELGPEVERPRLLPSPVPKVSTATGEILGEVVHVDRFGNLISNIPRTMLPDAESNPIVQIGSVELPRIDTTYADFREGETGALIDSSGDLEIAVRNGNAAETLRQARGAEIRVRWTPQDFNS